MATAPIPIDDELRVATLHHYQVLDSPAERGYDDITALATFICDAPFSTITLVDADRQWFKSEAGFGVKETGRSDGFCACAILRPQVMVVEDTLLDPQFCENPFVTGGPMIRFYAGAPLVAPNGQVIGTVCVFDQKPRQLSDAQIFALEALSRQVMALLESRLTLLEMEKAQAALIQTEKLAAVGRLASSMAHEINNPLEAVTNLLYLARMRSEDPSVLDWLEQADQELRRVGTIANQTLRFHKQASRPMPTTCLSMFTATLTAYEARLRNAGIVVEKRKRAEEPVECFEGDIRQVLSNLVTNAVDAMPTGGRLLVRSRIGTEWSTGRRGLVLTIADTGTGMDAATQRRMFEAFYSTKGIGGSGLGLWISREIMQRHEGSIRVRSSVGVGTVGALFLPFEKAALAA